MLSAWKPQRPTPQSCGPFLIELPCPTCYYSYYFKEEASWKCNKHHHGEPSLLSQMRFMLHTAKRAFPVHDAAYDVFMTFLPHTTSREDDVRPVVVRSGNRKNKWHEYKHTEQYLLHRRTPSR